MLSKAVDAVAWTIGYARLLCTRPFFLGWENYAVKMIKLHLLFYATVGVLTLPPLALDSDGDGRAF